MSGPDATGRIFDLLDFIHAFPKTGENSQFDSTMPASHRNTLRTPNLSRQPPAQGGTPQEHWLLDYIKKNPLQSGTALATLYGVIAIFAYHFHIEYFPSFDLKSLASTVFAAAYTTLLTLVVFSFVLFAPCYFIAAFCLDDESKKNDQELGNRIIGCFVVAFFSFLGLFVSFLLIVELDLPAITLFLLIPLVFLIYVLRVAHRANKFPADQDEAGTDEQRLPSDQWFAKLKRKWRGLGPTEQRNLKLGFAMMGTALMEIATMVMFFHMLRDSPHAQGRSIKWGELFLVAILSGAALHAIGCYLVVSWRSAILARRHRGYSLVLALCAPVITSFCAGDPVLFFSITAMTTKIGNFRAAELTLSNTGCQIIANSGASICTRLGDGTNKLCNVQVMSRLGTETYLLVAYPHDAAAAKPGDADSQPRPEWLHDVYVPSKEILGLQLDPSKRNFTKATIETAMAAEMSQCAGAPKPEAMPNKAEETFGNAQLFEFDLYALSASGKDELNDFVKRLADRKASTMSIRVVGHTDPIGNDYRNLQLSQLRALTVANYLEAQLKEKVKHLDVAWSGVGSSQGKTADGACPATAKHAERVACHTPDRRVEVSAVWTNDAGAKPQPLSPPGAASTAASAAPAGRRD